MHKTGIAVAVLMGIGAAGCAAAWYTGTQLEQALRSSLEQANQQLSENLPGVGVNLQLLALERGFFSSSAHYQLQLGSLIQAESAEPVLLDAVIEHGPWPWSRVKTGHLLPVMAASELQLQSSPLLAPWFAAAQGQPPLVGSTVLGYDQGLAGSFSFSPLQLQQPETQLAFSGASLDFHVSDEAQRLKFAARMEQLTLTGQAAETPLRLSINGVTLLSDRRLGPAELYLGNGQLSVERFEMQSGAKPALLLEQLIQTDSLTEDGTNLAASLGYELGNVSYNGQALGSSQFELTLSRLDPQAIRSLSDLYGLYALRLRQAPDAALSAEEQQQLQAGLNQLLADRPHLTLDAQPLKTLNGESRFNLVLDLAQPRAYDLPPETLVKQMLTQLSARLMVSKPLISDLAQYRAALEPDHNPQRAAEEAQQLAQMAGDMASAMQMGTVDGDNIVSSLSYAHGQVDFNGQQMPVEQLLGLLLAMAPGNDTPAKQGAAARPR